MLRRLGQVYTGVERTYKTAIMALVLLVLVGVGYGGYLAYGKIAGVLGFFKDSYGRGAGVAMVCATGEDQDGALCYPKCNDGYRGAGPVCWQSPPPTGCRRAPAASSPSRPWPSCARSATPGRR